MKLLPFFLALSDALDCENLADSENFKTITNSKIGKKCKNLESSKCDVMCSKGFQLSTYDKKIEAGCECEQGKIPNFEI